MCVCVLSCVVCEVNSLSYRCSSVLLVEGSVVTHAITYTSITMAVIWVPAASLVWCGCHGCSVLIACFSSFLLMWCLHAGFRAADCLRLHVQGQFKHY